jgi:hypothetical protein
VNFWVARAIVGIEAAHALKRNKADIAHFSGVWVLCVWPNGVIASYLEVAMARNECGAMSRLL